MRIVSAAGAGIASGALSMLVCSANANAATIVPRPSLVRAHAASATRARPQRIRGYAVNPGTCSTAGTHSFLGVGGGGNVAGGAFSAVLAGTNNLACDNYTGVGAGASNVIAFEGSAQNSFDGGGADNAIIAPSAGIGSGFGNEVTEGDGYIGAGIFNLAAGNGAFVGAGGTEYDFASSSAHEGGGNSASGIDSFVGAGDLNQIATSGYGSFVGAGDYLYAMSGASSAGNAISGADSFIGAGDQNVIGANEAFIGSGGINSISAAASFASILGGNRNAVTAQYASVLGGFGNSARGAYAIVAGGDGDTAAGTLSFAAGYHADAAHNGSFVWSDYSSGSKTLADTAANQFLVRASGGIHLYSNEAATSGVVLSPGSSTWASSSDRRAKADVVAVDDTSILAKVAALPIDRWSYTSERGVRHLGPMAQDFYAAFGTGTDDRHITSIDEDGVALAAIKGLDAELSRKSGEDARLRRDNVRLRADVDRLSRDLHALTNVVERLAARER